MIRTEINETIYRKTIENKTEMWCFEKLNKIGKPLTRLIKKRWKNQITRIRYEKGDSTVESTDIKKGNKEICEQLYANCMTTYMKWTDFLKIKLQKLTQEEIGNGIALTLVKKLKL